MERKGSVTLVGAGCGKGLITVKGLAVLKEADVVVYDDLTDQNLLLETKAGCEFIYAGKRLGRHSSSQEEINRILAGKAGEEKQVVRLKGGDGFVFGRGGEEILYLQENNIPYDVIPGVSSAFAVPGHAGIPVTHRSTAQSVTVVTGHSATGKEENYKALASLDGTLVFLMGLSRMKEITAALLENGKPPDTPAAVISKGYGAGEKRINGTLLTIAEKAEGAEAPAVFVVGPTADFRMRRTLRKELDGVSVTVTGTESFVRKAGGRLGGLGADTDFCPCLRVIPDTDNIPAQWDDFDWIVFTSANGVEVFFTHLRRRKTDLRKLSAVKFACIGHGTSEKLAEYGIYPDFEPSVFMAGELGKELCLKLEPEERVLILRAQNGSPDLTEELKRGNISYADIPVYHTEAAAERIRGRKITSDYIIFGSAYGVGVFLEHADFSDRTVPVCIGPSTREALQKIRRGHCLVPKEYTVEGITEEILNDRKYRDENPDWDNAWRDKL